MDTSCIDAWFARRNAKIDKLFDGLIKWLVALGALYAAVSVGALYLIAESAIATRAPMIIIIVPAPTKPCPGR